MHSNERRLTACTCASFPTQDSAQERRKISTTEELNEADKEYNRLIANTLIENGLYAEVESDTGFIKELPRRKTPSNTSVASTTNDTGAAVSQQEDRASTGRAQTEVAPVSDQQQARTPLQQLEAKVADAARAEAETDARASAQAAAGPSPFATEQRLRIGVQRPDHEQDLVPAPPSAGHVVAATPRAQAAALALQKSLSQGRTSLPMAGSLNPVESHVSVGSSLQSALSKAKMRTNSLFSLTEDEIAQIQKVRQARCIHLVIMHTTSSLQVELMRSWHTGPVHAPAETSDTRASRGISQHTNMREVSQ